MRQSRPDASVGGAPKPGPVIPAQAGIQGGAACQHLLDSRLRGNDGVADFRLRGNDGWVVVLAQAGTQGVLTREVAP